MKHLPLILIFSLLFVTACQEKSSKKKSSSNSSNLCIGTGYYTVPGCPGFVQGGTTTGGTTGGTTNQLCFQGTNYYQMQGCPGFCTNYPAHASCATTGGTTGTPTNPYANTASNAIYQNWGVQYPGGEPTGTCEAAYKPAGMAFTPYETRKATMAIQGKTFYSPVSAVASSYENTSSILKTLVKAKSLFETDSVLKVRFKVRAQPENTSSSPYCYIPSYTKMSSVAGYTKLQYNVILVGERADGSTDQEPLGTFTTGVNSCSPAIDLSSYASQYPGGIYLIVQSVKGNQGTYPNDYAQKGFTNSNTYADIRSMDCWVLDVEVAADGTKTFE